MVLVEGSGEFAQLHGARSSDHRCVFVAEVDELFPESVFLLVAAGVGVAEEVARADAAAEPVGLGEAEDDGCKNTLDFVVGECTGDDRHGFGGLFADNSLVY